MNKCNITSLVLSRLNKFKKGQYCVDDSAILDNYVDSTSCIERSTCYEDNCSNPLIQVLCNISVVGMVRDVQENVANIFMVDGNIVQGTPPYTYSWSFDEKLFNLVSGKYEPVLTIISKNDKDFHVIISAITCTIIDALGCHTTKTCYISPTGMQCASNYSYCANPMSLVIKNKQINCPKPMGLIISKKS